MEILKRELLYQGFYRFERLLLKSQNSGQVVDREQFHTPDSVGILVYHPESEKVILVEQFRVGPEKKLLEIVAGKLEGKDKNPEATAKREVEEETGYRVKQLRLIHQFYTSPGPVTEKMHLFYAEVDKKISSGGGLASELEEIEVQEWEKEKFLAYSFEDAKTIMAQFWLRLNS